MMFEVDSGLCQFLLDPFQFVIPFDVWVDNLLDRMFVGKLAFIPPA